MSETVQRLTRAISTVINVPGKRQFTDPEIKDFINRAIGWAQVRMRSSPVKDLRFEASVTLAQGDTSLSVGTANELPSNFIIPIRLWEKQNGKWKEMSQSPDHLPINADPKDCLLWWEWREGKLKFIGATQAIDLKIQYRGSIPEVNVPLDTIPINGLDEVVIAKACAIGGVIGELNQAQYWESTASELLDRFIQTNMKPYQAVGFRRKRRRISLPPWRY
jgi:hypothetical protein